MTLISDPTESGAPGAFGVDDRVVEADHPPIREHWHHQLEKPPAHRPTTRIQTLVALLPTREPSGASQVAEDNVRPSGRLVAGKRDAGPDPATRSACFAWLAAVANYCCS